MIRGKPKKIALGDGVNPAEAPQGYMAIKGWGDCHSSMSTGNIACCFLDGYNCTGGGADEMHCVSKDRTDDKTVIYRKLTNDQG
jgi:hypothetical protein